MYSCDELFLHSLECYFCVYFPRCLATQEINTKITLSWVVKQFITQVHTLSSISNRIECCWYDSYQLEKLERLHSEDTPATSWLPILLSHIGSQIICNNMIAQRIILYSILWFHSENRNQMWDFINADCATQWLEVFVGVFLLINVEIQTKVKRLPTNQTPVLNTTFE